MGVSSTAISPAEDDVETEPTRALGTTCPGTATESTGVVETLRPSGVVTALEDRFSSYMSSSELECGMLVLAAVVMLRTGAEGTVLVTTVSVLISMIHAYGMSATQR